MMGNSAFTDMMFTDLVPMIEKETKWTCGRDFGFCYNPEFIALGNVVNGLLEPDLVLIGESDPESGAALEAVYKRYNRNKPRIARMRDSDVMRTLGGILAGGGGADVTKLGWPTLRTGRPHKCDTDCSAHWTR